VSLSRATSRGFGVIGSQLASLRTNRGALTGQKAITSIVADAENGFDDGWSTHPKDDDPSTASFRTVSWKRSTVNFADRRCD
jgi:hypothetical protein